MQVALETGKDRDADSPVAFKGIQPHQHLFLFFSFLLYTIVTYLGLLIS